MVFVVLAVNVQKGRGLRVQFALSDHVCSLEGFAHRYILQMLNIIFEMILIFLGTKDCSTKVLDLDHVCRFMIMNASLVVEKSVLTYD